MRRKKRCTDVCVQGVLLFLVGCGGGSSTNNPPTLYAIGGTVSGLAASSFTLQLNGASDLSVSANGAFKFPNPVTSGTAYLVTVSQQPAGSSQTCVVTNAAGTVESSQIADINVTCLPMGISLLAGQLGGPGNTDGPVTAARFSNESAVSVDPLGNLYFADGSGSVIRRMSTDGMVSTVAGTRGMSGNVDGTGANARFRTPSGLTTDSAGNVYITDEAAFVVRKLTPAGTVTTFAGIPGVQGASDGIGAGASFSQPQGIAADVAGDLYVDDSSSLRLISPSSAVTTLQGNLGTTYNIAVDTSGTLFFTDQNGYVSTRTPAGVISILAGSNATGSNDGVGAAAQFNSPTGIAMDANGNAYVADTKNDTIRLVTTAGVVTTLAGSAGMQGTSDGTGSAARFNWPGILATDTAGNAYVEDILSGIIRKVTPLGVVATIAGVPAHSGFSDGTGAAAKFAGPRGVAMDRSGNIYVADAQNNVIRKISLAGVVTTLAGSGAAGFQDGTGSAAQFSFPLGIATDAAGNVYVADTNNVSIRMITAGGVVTTLAGNGSVGFVDGTGVAARFGLPYGIVSDGGQNLYVADVVLNAVRKVTTAGVVTTIAGGSDPGGYADGVGRAALFRGPQSISIDAAGNLYVADSGNNVIRKITPQLAVSTLAGDWPGLGYNDGPGSAALFFNPTDIVCDDAGNVYVADASNDVIRKVTPDGMVTTVAGVHLSVGVQLGPLPGSMTTKAGLGLAMVPHSSKSLVVADAAENTLLLLNLP